MFELHRIVRNCIELCGIASNCVELHRIVPNCCTLGNWLKQSELSRIWAKCERIAPELHRIASNCTELYRIWEFHSPWRPTSQIHLLVGWACRDLQRDIAHLKGCGDSSRIKSFTQLLGDIWKMLKSRLIDVALDIRYCHSDIHSIFTRNESRPAIYDIIYKLLNNLFLISMISGGKKVSPLLNWSWLTVCQEDCRLLLRWKMDIVDIDKYDSLDRYTSVSWRLFELGLHREKLTVPKLRTGLGTRDRGRARHESTDLSLHQ